jgi:hypothetical protein
LLTPRAAAAGNTARKKHPAITPVSSRFSMQNLSQQETREIEMSSVQAAAFPGRARITAMAMVNVISSADRRMSILLAVCALCSLPNREHARNRTMNPCATEHMAEDFIRGLELRAGHALRSLVSG